ncbi:hypothetical protein D049_1532B, partial [Vibrio parahaemolyticus VPTS-2010]
RTSFTPSGT